MELRNPRFGNSFTLDPGVRVKHTLGGTLIMDTSRPKTESFSVEFEALSVEQRDAFLEFVESVSGQEISINDHEGFNWTGFIVDPIVESAQTGRGCKYTCKFTFDGIKFLEISI